MMLNFFYNHICHDCKEYSVNLKTCSACKLVFYCSVSHQKSNWKNHKEFCKVVQKILKDGHFFKVPVLSKEEWVKMRISIMSFIEVQMPRPMRFDEKQMLLFPNVCNICYKFPPSREYSCEVCHIVNYCSKEHKEKDHEKHVKDCEALDIGFNVERCYYQGSFEPANFFPELYKLKYQQKANWKDIETFIEENISEDVQFQLTDEETNNISFLSNKLRTVVLSDFFSAPLTILHSIFSSNKKNLHKMESLKIHVLGVNDYEMYNVIYSFELIFHLVPSIKKLTIWLVGPEGQKYDSLEPVRLCSECRDSRQLSFRLMKTTYHSLVNKSDFDKPHLVVALNCGFHEYEKSSNDTWLETVKILLDIPNIILLFTSYNNHEAIQDFSLTVRDRDLKNYLVHKMCGDNQFKCLRPMRDWEARKSGVFYNNYYQSIIETFG